MPIFDDVDLGRASLSAGPGYSAPSSVGDDTSIRRSQTIEVKAPAAIGGQNAGSKAAAKILAVQLAEMVDSVRFVQWESGDGVLVPSAFDGWWHIDSVEPVDFVWSTHVSVRVSATLVEVDSLRLAYRYQGGSLASNYTGPATPLIPYPVGSTALVGTTGTRVTADGTIPYTLSPLGGVTRLPYVPSSTIANRFLGGVKVYDSMSAGGNAPPASGAAHASWVQVYGPNHVYTGDMIVTNGLLLLIFALGTARLFRGYTWSTGLATASWQQVGDLQYLDSATNIGTLRTFDPVLVSSDLARVTVEASTVAGHVAEVTVHLRRGLYSGRADFRPLTQANTVGSGLRWLFANTIKVAFSSGAMSDPALAVTALGIQTDYGYVGGYTANSGQPFLSGLLNLNKPNAAPGNTTTDVNIGDSTTPTQGNVNIYGFWAFPFGVSGTYSTANLQGEGESGTLGAGWSSVADGAASGGNTAKAATGTAANSTDVFGASLVLPGGVYDLWMRVRVASTAGTGNMIFGLQENGAGGIVFQGGALGPSSFTTGYLWYRMWSGYVADGVKSQRFMCSVNVVLGTDYFVDEAVWVPRTLAVGDRGPQTIFQQFLYEYDLVDA